MSMMYFILKVFQTKRGLAGMFTRTIRYGKRNILIIFLSGLYICPAVVHAEALPALENRLISYVRDNTELTASCFLTRSDSVVVQLPTVHTSLQDQLIYAEELALQGQSVCLSNFFSDLFLPLENSSYHELPIEDYARFLQQIAGDTGRSIYFATHARGARFAARLTRHLRDNNMKTPNGLIFFSPNLLDEAPEAGKAHRYAAELDNPYLPMYVFQPEYSPHYWHLQTLREHLRSHAYRFHIEKLPRVRDGYPLREDRTPVETALRKRTGALLRSAIEKLRAVQ